MSEVVEQLAEEYGWSDSVPNLSGKLRRGSLRYSEAVELADVLGYPIQVKAAPLRHRGDRRQILFLLYNIRARIINPIFQKIRPVFRAASPGQRKYLYFHGRYAIMSLVLHSPHRIHLPRTVPAFLRLPQ